MKTKIKTGPSRLSGCSPVEAAVSRLAETIARWTKDGQVPETGIPKLGLFRYEKPSQPESGMYEPSICLIAQGSKRVMLGNDIYVYDSQHYLISAVDLPTIVQVLEASLNRPLLGLVMKLDLKEIAQMMATSNLPQPQQRQASRGMATGEITGPLLSAFQRLLDLLDEPKAISSLAPLIQQEICYRLLVGDQGVRLRQMASAGSLSRQIEEAIRWLRTNFTQPLRIEDLAGRVNMSNSSFHHHFRALTAMSPLQYQKNLRLNEARRLMLMERFDATTAALQVGYESPSQFSREYRRLFGAPPLRNVRGVFSAATTKADPG